MQLTYKSNKIVFCFTKKFSTYVTVSENHITLITDVKSSL